MSQFFFTPYLNASLNDLNNFVIKFIIFSIKLVIVNNIESFKKQF